MLVALAFRMPGADALISLLLLLLVLGLVFFLARYFAKTEPWATVVTAIGVLILIVILLQTFTTWGG